MAHPWGGCFYFLSGLSLVLWFLNSFVGAWLAGFVNSRCAVRRCFAGDVGDSHWLAGEMLDA